MNQSCNGHRKMRAISAPNIESELSYAYLHAVASHAGMACQEANRHHDGNGIDARVTAWLPYVDAQTLREVDINIQLKATIAVPSDDGVNLTYRLTGAQRYNDLRSEVLAVPRIIVVLFLPANAESWLEHSVERLALCRCAYWESLRGAQAITTDSTNVKLPKNQMFSPQSLKQIAERLSRRDFPTYPAP